ncbi:MAG: hypothetical protein AB7K24_28370, partial [Gemmataceae bacterium]
MHRSIIALSLFVLGVNADGPAPNPADEQLIKAAGVDTDGPALLNYLKQQTLVAQDKDRIRKMIRLLGDEDFGNREKAQADLIALGRVATKFLEEA